MTDVSNRKFQRGDDVIVEFGGLDHQGEVLSQSAGYVMVRMIADPTADYGDITPRLDPEPTVCVKENRVRPANTSETTTM